MKIEPLKHKKPASPASKRAQGKKPDLPDTEDKPDTPTPIRKVDTPPVDSKAETPPPEQKQPSPAPESPPNETGSVKVSNFRFCGPIMPTCK